MSTEMPKWKRKKREEEKRKGAIKANYAGRDMNDRSAVQNTMRRAEETEGEREKVSEKKVTLREKYNRER